MVWLSQPSTSVETDPGLGIGQIELVPGEGSAFGQSVLAGTSCSAIVILLCPMRGCMG